MAMSKPRLANNIFTRLVALYRTRPDNTQNRDIDYFLRTWSNIVAEEVITEIQGHARAIGTDSGGDSIDIPIF